MRGLKIIVSTTALLVGLALVPAAPAQVVVDIGVQPVCQYGYYGYAPYGCAPMGYYGSGYFYNGIFLGMGPWAGWGYGHGWGDHRFSGDGGGRYHGGVGRIAYGGRSDDGHRSRDRGAPVNRRNSNAGEARPSPDRRPNHSSAPRNAPHASTPRGAAPHGDRGQAPRGSGQPHGEGRPGGDHK